MKRPDSHSLIAEEGLHTLFIAHNGKSLAKKGRLVQIERHPCFFV
jgi:hypothetical protein